ncbi:MAG: glycosyl hydrolase family 28-related protein [Phycisphaerales bacterium JB040]
MHLTHHLAPLLALLLPLTALAQPSRFTSLPDDPAAIVLTPDAFNAHPNDGLDDTDALQAAIDAASSNTGGLLFIPSGNYRLTRTLYVWPGVRLVGYGHTRPVFTLPASTPGFTEGDDTYLLYFSGGRGRNPGDPPRDGSPGTFYSALTNIDITIEPGNHAAVAVRFHVAQHCSLSHMRIELNDARAGLADIGNLVEHLHITGGDYAIDTARSAPGWPIAVLDCTLENQAVAAIRTREAGLAIVRPTIRNSPAAVLMEPDVPDQLWISDARFENISGPAVRISRPTSARTQVSLENIACDNVPTLAASHDGTVSISAPAERYLARSLTHGLHLGLDSSPRRITTRASLNEPARLPPPVTTDAAPLPPTHTWVNVTTLGVTPDDNTDDTAALQAAIDAHPTLYFPTGWYDLSDTVTLRHDTTLIALHPARTVLNLPNDTPAFNTGAQPKPLLDTPAGGTNTVSGLGLYTGERNHDAVALRWRAGPESLIDDVRFHGGHGTTIPGRDLSRLGDRDHWNTQPASLLVHGGGVLKNIWTPNPHARSGLHIENTTTRGRLYAMSAEHHVDREVILDHAANWSFFALQFETEREESPRCLPLEITGSADLLFANTFFYRVVSSLVPSPNAVTVDDSTDVRFRNVHVYSNSKVSHGTAVYDASTDTPVRDPEFTALDLPPATPPTLPPTVPPERVRVLADGFLNISGLAVDPSGDAYFADPRTNAVYRWSHESDTVEHLLDVPERPEQLAFDNAGHLLIIAYEGDGAVLALDPDDTDAPPTRLEPRPAKQRPGATPVLPVNRWQNDAAFLESATAPHAAHYLSPDGTTFIPASDEFTTGATRWGTKLSGLLRAFAVAPATPGKPFYVTNEHDLRTHAFDVNPDGTLSNPRLFAEEGGECVIAGPDGTVYLAAGQIQVFNPLGVRTGVIHVPQRPTSLALAGPDRRTLIITARDTLYALTLAD